MTTCARAFWHGDGTAVSTRKGQRRRLTPLRRPSVPAGTGRAGSEAPPGEPGLQVPDGPGGGDALSRPVAGGALGGRHRPRTMGGRLRQKVESPQGTGQCWSRCGKTIQHSRPVGHGVGRKREDRWDPELLGPSSRTPSFSRPGYRASGLVAVGAARGPGLEQVTRLRGREPHATERRTVRLPPSHEVPRAKSRSWSSASKKVPADGRPRASGPRAGRIPAMMATRAGTGPRPAPQRRAEAVQPIRGRRCSER